MQGFVVFRSAIRVAALAVLGLVLIAGCDGPVQSGAKTAQSSNNMKQIVLALHNYHDEWKQLPFAGTEKDAEGDSTRSWRTALLPYIEQRNLYHAYDFKMPWNSPKNQELVKTAVITQFHSPLDTSSRTNTSYLVVRGKDTAFPARVPKVFGDMDRDGMSNTIAVVEVLNTGIHWAEPRDLVVEELDFVIRRPADAKPGQLNGAHPNGLLVGMMDGTVNILPYDTDPKVVESLIKLDGQGVWPK
jgi:hypothetical protein